MLGNRLVKNEKYQNKGAFTAELLKLLIIETIIAATLASSVSVVPALQCFFLQVSSLLSVVVSIILQHNAQVLKRIHACHSVCDAVQMIFQSQFSAGVSQ